MNAKTAKKLRKIAKQMATQELVYTPQGNSRRFVVEPVVPTNDGMKLSGNIPLPGDAVAQQQKINYLIGSVVVNEQSARGIYKMLKKATGQQ